MSTVIVAIRCRVHNRDQNKPFAVWHVAFDAENKRCYRELRFNGHKLKPGAWSHTPRPLAPGLYCEHCMAEGLFTPMIDDPKDLADVGLGDPPVVFNAPAGIQAMAEAEALRERFPDRIAHVMHVPAVEAQYAEEDALAQLHPAVRKALTERILPRGARLYRFQAEAIAAALRGEDVMTTTPTASGKSICYWAPVLHGLLSDPHATMIYVSPLLALTEDQFAGLTRYADDAELWAARAEVNDMHTVLRELRFGGQKLTVARYDGQTHTDFRSAIRAKRPRIILTTPDMLHAGLLRGADSRWAELFGGLKYIVFDELHSYRGVLGSQFANLMRRLLRLTSRAGQHVQILSASATLARPTETAQALLGRPSTVVDARIGGAARAARTMVVLNSASGDETRALVTEAKNVITHLMTQKLPTLAFVQAIAEGTRIQRLVETELKSRGQGHVKVEAYYRELLKTTKKDLIDGLRTGSLQCLVSTRALSMGIDIHQVAAAVLVGYPGSIAEFWQQAGRAGRGGEGLVVYIAGSSPVDQFFVQNPEMLHQLEAEPTFCNPDNPMLVRGHLLLAVGERALKPEEVARFGPAAPAALAALETEGLLERRGELWVRTEDGEQAPSMPFRDIGFSVTAYDQDRKAVAQLDLTRAHRAYHWRAVVQVEDTYYEVQRQILDIAAQRGEIRLRRVQDPTYVTAASFTQHVRVLDTEHGRALATGTAAVGPVRVKVTVEGFTREPLPGRAEEAGYQPLGRGAPEPLVYDTQGIWLALDPAQLPACEPKELAAGLFSAAGALRLAIAITQMCDPSDLGAEGMLGHPDLAGQPGIFVFDTMAGGIGIAQAAFGDMDAALARAHAILAECPYCTTHPESLGCPQCVTTSFGQEDGINRHVALEILGRLV